MNHSFIVCVILCVAQVNAQITEQGNLQMQNIPAIPDEISNSLRSYQEFRAATFHGIHPGSGQILMSTRFGETNQLHTIKMAMGDRQQITFFKEPIGAAVYSPDKTSNGLIYSKDEGGNEFSQFFWMDAGTGHFRMFTNGGKTQNTNLLWSNSGSKLVYSSTARNKKDYDIYLVKIDQNGPGTPSLLLEVNGSWSAVDWSQDEKYLLIRENISVNKSRLYSLEISSKKLTEIRPGKEEIAYGSAAFNQSGTGIFFCSDEGTEFQTLKFLNLQSGSLRAISHSLQWDVTSFKLNKTRDQGVFIVNENGIDKVYSFSTADMKYFALDNLPRGLITGFGFDGSGKTLGLSVSTAQIPGDIYTINLSTKNLVRWTESETGGLSLDHFPVAELISYPTFDQANGGTRMVPAYIYRPKNKIGKTPVLINIHGGPEGQSRPSFNAYASFLATELGLTIIMPNVRGSTGYGKNYVKLDNGLLREDAVKDIGELLNWIGSRQDLDSSRVAVIGGSYGGYMSLASMTNFNARLRCGVDIVGISNFVSFLKNTEDYRKDLRRVEYGDERDEKTNSFLQQISPLNNAAKISKPVFIVQGANDPRVPMSEAVQMKEKLIGQGNQVWFLLAKDEGHGFRKKTNVDYYQYSTALFLKTYLCESTR